MRLHCLGWACRQGIILNDVVDCLRNQACQFASPSFRLLAIQNDSPRGEVYGDIACRLRENQHRLGEGVGDAQFIEDVWVPPRDICDDEIRAIDALSDVLQDVGGRKQIVAADWAHTRCITCAGEDAVNVCGPWFAKGHHDEAGGLGFCGAVFWCCVQPFGPEKQHVLFQSRSRLAEIV